MSDGAYADVTIAAEKGRNRHRMVKITSNNQHIVFTEAALEYAIERGDFSLT